MDVSSIKSRRGSVHTCILHRNLLITSKVFAMFRCQQFLLDNHFFFLIARIKSKSGILSFKADSRGLSQPPDGAGLTLLTHDDCRTDTVMCVCSEKSLPGSGGGGDQLLRLPAAPGGAPNRSEKAVGPSAEIPPAGYWPRPTTLPSQHSQQAPPGCLSFQKQTQRRAAPLQPGRLIAAKICL